MFFPVLLRFGIGLIPGISIEAAWTLTNLSYNALGFVMFHGIAGTPFLDQNDFYGMTVWEQIDGGAQFTPTKKYLTAAPIVLFLVSTHYTHYDTLTFFVNLLSLVVVLVAKLPSMHKVRLFGIGEHPIRDYNQVFPGTPPRGNTSPKVTRRTRTASYS
ncbi:ORMDL family-domain-containing protein, partial [Gorgonomyces haynaldii]